MPFVIWLSADSYVRFSDMKIVAVVGLMLLIAGRCIPQAGTTETTTGVAPPTTSSASGWFTPHCDGAAFHLARVDGLSSDDILNLTLRQEQPLTWWVYRPEEAWTWLYAERCTPSGQCEEATRARIWLNKCAPDAKRVSGKYGVDFGERHLAGTFRVKYRKEKQLWTCE